MRVFAIGDLHLSFGTDKPMDVFGESWRDHAQRLDRAWRAAVGADDLVLIPGDISWAIRLQQAADDLSFICGLPGKKLLLRGNHDYWWSSLTQVERALDASARVVQNNALTVGGFTIGGTRGWTLPDEANEAADTHIYQRELIRLEMSLSRMEEGRRRIAMLHFPPTDVHGADTGMTKLLEKYGVEIAVYAHLHGRAHRAAFIGEKNGVRYVFAAADYLQFQPLLIAEE